MADVKELNVNNTTYDIKAKSVVDTNSGKLFFWSGTKNQFDAIVTKDANTLYNITDDASPSSTVYSKAEVDSLVNSSADGQWVFDMQQLTTSGAIGAQTLDLSNYLPSDGYNYEVIITGEVYFNSSPYSYGFIESDVYPKTLLFDVGNNARVFIFNQMVVVGLQRELTLTIKGSAATWEDVGGQQGLYVVGYRRLGANQ